MTDGTTATDETDEESTDGRDATPDGADADVPAGADDREATAEDGDDDSGNRIAQSLLKVAMVVLILLGLVATFRFYFAASNAIAIWFSSDFVPIFQAAFNLLLLLGSIAGLAFVVRRIRE